MNRKTKIGIITAGTVILAVYWLALALTGTKYHMVNYYWQAALAVLMLAGGVFGLMTAKHWGGLKSGVGRGVFFISLGMIMWGIGQAGWTYFVIKDPSQQTPPTHILDVIYSSSIPLWFYGMFKLSQATGARYGLRRNWAKAAVVALIVVMFALSYYLLVNVARGGLSYFHQDFWDIFFDLGYAAGDAINLTLAIAIFGLSWKLLGGRFKKPIVTILAAFLMIFLADLLFSFYDGKGQYYNGHWTDLLYLTMVADFALGVVLLDPRENRVKSAVPAAGAAPVEQPAPMLVPAVPAPIDPVSVTAAPVASAVPPVTPEEESI